MINGRAIFEIGTKEGTNDHQLTVTGELDIATLDEVKLWFQRFQETTSDTAYFNFANVRYMDSLTLRELIRLLHELKDKQARKVVLTDVQPQIAKILRLTGVIDLFDEA